MANDTQARGRFLRWFHGSKGPVWGRDPGEYSPIAVEETMRWVDLLFGPGRYFRLDAHGWEHVPDAPVMIVSNHSGGTTIPDVWGFLAGWYRRFGAHRPIHPMAHEIILSTEATGRFFGTRGVLRANHTLASDVLTHWKRDLMVMPGGDIDTWRPYSERYSVRFGGRKGYARLALKAGVPVVPVANAGAHETLFIITDGRAIARKMGLHELMRAEIFPIHLSFPWGLAIGPWPHIPMPAKLRYRIGAPVPAPEGAEPGQEPTSEQVDEYDRRVREAVQRLLDMLRDAP